MKILKSIQEWKDEKKNIVGKIGFVPTMGALHLGHLSLVRFSKKDCEKTIVSIFVNPTQFNDPNDLKAYPRMLEEDALKLENEGVDYIFAPEFSELYPDDYSYVVTEKKLSNVLCGKSRPGHFDGVLSVVMKLFNIVEADKAYFGEKDYQQLELIKGMVEAFFMKTQIIPCPTIREEDGLAMSSRNLRLSAEGRLKAPLFHRALLMPKTCEEVKNHLEKLGFKVDYIEERLDRRFGAVFLDNVRLIDNVAR